MPDTKYDFTKPIPRQKVGGIHPVYVFPTFPEVINREFCRPPFDIGIPEVDDLMRFSYAAIDYQKTKVLDKESCKAKEGIDILDAFAHLNYLVWNTFFGHKYITASIATCMWKWFDVVPPKHLNEKFVTVTQ